MNKQKLIEKIRKDNKILLKVPDKMFKNRTFIKSIAKINPDCFEFIKEKYNWIRKDKEIAKLSVKKNGLSLRLFSEEVRDDCNIVRYAFEQNIISIIYATDKAFNILWEEYEEHIDYDLLI